MKCENEFSALLSRNEYLTELKTKKLGYHLKTIKKLDETSYITDGWKVHKKNKNTVKIKKDKTYDVAFEDTVWTLLAKLGFDYLNKDRNFKIKYQESVPGKQIDVFAADEEVVLIVECKSSDSQRTANFQKDIHEIAGIRENIIRRIQQHFRGKPKIAWLFCTNNYIVKNNDIDRLKENKVIYFNQDDIAYFDLLIERIGVAAKYQLLGRIFAKQTIPNMKSIIPAIRGDMGQHTYYSFAIEPETLLQMSYVLHRVQSTDETLSAYQRIVNSKRIKDIQQFIDAGNFFPNAIIINIDTDNGNSLRFDIAKPQREYESDTQIGLLHLPKTYRCAYIIDGQHRLYGYSGSKYKSSNTIPVIAFENLSSDVQAKLFVDINSKQKSVNRNLLSTLDADLRWNSDNKDDAIKALKSKLIQNLTEKGESPLYNKIITGESQKTKHKCITLAYFSDYGLNRCKFFGELQRKRLVKIGYLCDGDDLSEKTLKKAYSFMKQCFETVYEKLPAQWALGDSEDGGFIAKNIGISSLVVILNDILEFLDRENKIRYSIMTADELYSAIEPYLLIVLDNIKKLQPEDLRNMAKQYGAGGVEKVRRKFQQWIHEKIKEFCPVGLEEYIRDSSGQFNGQARIIIDKLQKRINEFISIKLKDEYGENDWWSIGVPGKIQKECVNRAIDEGRKEPEWHYLLLMHYHEIIIARWSLLGNYFTPPDKEQKGKDEKVSWFRKVNDLRNRVAHPERSSIKKDEFDFIVDTEKWLLEKLKLS